MQFDVTRAAWFTEALRVAALAEQHGATVAPHTAPELHSHLVLALPRCAWGVEFAWRRGDPPCSLMVFRDAPHLHDGHLTIADAPGSGLDIDWTFVEKYRVFSPHRIPKGGTRWHATVI